jgi:glycerophosphoryl diester phosphodiesterase
MITRKSIAHVLLATLALLNLGAEPVASALLGLPATIAALLNLEVRPFAIAHRGFGDNHGEDPTRPVENTLEAVRAGYEAGASVVEVDVQLTRDGEVVVFHDDFLPDFTCLNQLTRTELDALLPQAPTLREVLAIAAEFNDRSGPMSGLLIVELKPAAPLCDPEDAQERAIVTAVVRTIRGAGMTRQVLLTSFSPALLALAQHKAPEIARALAVSGLQFLNARQIEAELGLPVTRIDKQLDLGLRWAEIGPIFRLPGYASVPQVLRTAERVGARAVEADLFLLSSRRGARLVRQAHARGLEVFGFTATNLEEWQFLASLGVDGIYTNDVPLGVERQAPVPVPSAREVLAGAR